MTAKLDRALGDIISEDNESRPRRGRGGGRGGRGRRESGGGGQRRNPVNPLARDDEEGPQEYAPVRRQRGARAAPYQREPRQTALFTTDSDGGDWQHDLYAGSDAGAAQPRQISRGPFKVLATNLDAEVKEPDLVDIFAECGEKPTAHVDVDASGRHLGTATLTFRLKSAADKAIREFDGAAVDGRPMYLKLLPGPGASRVQVVAPVMQQAAAPRAAPAFRYENGGGQQARQQYSAPRMTRGGGRGRGGAGGQGRGARRGGGGAGSRGGAGGGGGRGRKEKEAVSAESLDAEMDAYVKNAPAKQSKDAAASAASE